MLHGTTLQEMLRQITAIHSRQSRIYQTSVSETIQKPMLVKA